MKKINTLIHVLILTLSFSFLNALNKKLEIADISSVEQKLSNPITETSDKPEVNILSRKVVAKINSEKEVVKIAKVKVNEKPIETRKESVPKSEKKDFIQEFLLSFSLNFFSEIGDKSFVSIILVYNQISPCVLFFVASIAELLMNLFSVIIGYELRTHPLIKIWCHCVGSITALMFGLMLIYEVYFSKEEKEEETEKVDLEKGSSQENEAKQKSSLNTLLKIANIAWIIFISELGDKSQITTIILSAEYSPIPIFIGTAVAHILGVLLSMTIGYIISKNINKVILTTIGAVCFIYFGVQTGINFFNEGGPNSLLQQSGLIH